MKESTNENVLDPTKLSRGLGESTLFVLRIEKKSL